MKNSSAWKHCPVLRELTRKSVPYMKTVSVEAPHGRQLGLQISYTVRCFWSTWPARPICPYKTTSSGATSKARYTVHVLPVLTTQNREFGCVFQGSLKKCYSGLRHPFYRNCRNFLNDMGVTYEVSFSSSNG